MTIVGQADEQGMHPVDAADAWEWLTLPVPQRPHAMRAAREMHGDAWEEYVGGEVWLAENPVDLLLAIAAALEEVGLDLVTHVRAWHGRSEPETWSCPVPAAAAGAKRAEISKAWGRVGIFDGTDDGVRPSRAVKSPPTDRSIEREKRS